jgi:hypothetical protein
MQPRGLYRLRVALGVLLVAQVGVSLLAWLLTKHLSWVGHVIQPAALALMAWLLLRGHSWARRVLVVWLAITTVTTLGALLAASPGGLTAVALLAIAMSVVYVWVAAEILMADSSTTRAAIT